MKAPLVDRLQEVRCDREPFSPEHANCICRLTGEAADEIKSLRRQLSELRAAFRVNMLRHAQIENVDAEIDRVLKQME